MSNKTQHQYKLCLQNCPGTFTLNYDASNSGAASVPVRFTVDYDGTITTSGFVGDHLHDIQLAALLFPSVNSFPMDSPVGSITITKNSASAPTAILTVDSPLIGAVWTFEVICSLVCPTTTTTTGPSTTTTSPTTTTTTTMPGVTTTTTTTIGPPCIHCACVPGAPTYNLYSWGANSSSQLGDGTIVDKHIPTNIGSYSASSYTISTGYSHSMILVDHKLYMWGSNIKGQLGNNTNSDLSTPTQSGLILTGGTLKPGLFKYATLGKRHSVGISPAGFMYAWGDNSYGQLGDGTSVDKIIPTIITSVDNGSNTIVNAPSWKKVVASNHNLAIDQSGRLYAWGNNDHGQLGNVITTPTTTTTITPLANSSTPLLIGSASSTDKWLSIVVGDSHSMGLKWNSILPIASNLELYTWGSNQYGQLGDGTNISSSTPIKIPNPVGAHWVVIACGSDHSMGLDNTGRLYTWGRNNHGQLGDGTNANRNLPTSTSSTVFNLIDGGGNNSIAVDGLKNLYSWGDNSSGELGDNTLVDKKNIVKNIYLDGLLEVSTGNGYHSLALSVNPFINSATTTTPSGTTTTMPSIPCCPCGPTSGGETHLHSGNGANDPFSPIIWDDNVNGEYWMIEWYEVDSNDGVHAWISKRMPVCLFPGTNRIESVQRIGSPKGFLMSSVKNKSWAPNTDCNPLCTETQHALMLSGQYDYEAITELKGFGGMQWRNTQYIASQNISNFPTNGVIGPVGPGQSICGSSCSYRAYGSYSSVLDSLTLGLMSNQPGSGSAEAHNVIHNFACLKARLDGDSCGGLPKINFYLSQEDKEHRDSLFPRSPTLNRDTDDPCCSANDMVRGSEECGGGGDPPLDPPTECPDTPCACYYMTDGMPECILLSPSNLWTCSLSYNGTLNCDCSGACVTTPPPTDWWRCKGDGNCCHVGEDVDCESCNDQDPACYKGYMANITCSSSCTTTTPPVPTATLPVPTATLPVPTPTLPATTTTDGPTTAPPF